MIFRGLAQLAGARQGRAELVEGHGEGRPVLRIGLGELFAHLEGFPVRLDCPGRVAGPLQHVADPDETPRRVQEQRMILG